MPDWFPVAYAFCGIAALGFAVLTELIMDEKISLAVLMIALVLAALGPVGLVGSLLGVYQVSKEKDFVLYRRKKEPPQ